jgi:hypothetical protein
VNEAAVLKAKKIFEQNAQRERKRGELGDSLFFEMFEAVNFEGLCADVEGVARFEGVASGDGHAASFPEVRTSMITEKAERGVVRRRRICERRNVVSHDFDVIKIWRRFG